MLPVALPAGSALPTASRSTSKPTDLPVPIPGQNDRELQVSQSASLLWQSSAQGNFSALHRAAAPTDIVDGDRAGSAREKVEEGGLGSAEVCDAHSRLHGLRARPAQRRESVISTEGSVNLIDSDEQLHAPSMDRGRTRHQEGKGDGQCAHYALPSLGAVARLQHRKQRILDHRLPDQNLPHAHSHSLPQFFQSISDRGLAGGRVLLCGIPLRRRGSARARRAQ